jgi:hypothetical protein
VSIFDKIADSFASAWGYYRIMRIQINMKKPFGNRLVLSMRITVVSLISLMAVGWGSAREVISANGGALAVSPGPDGHLKYAPDAFGNTIPDFSLAGYCHGGVVLPVAPVVETLNPVADSKDDSIRIQAALDRVAQAPERVADGVRGALLLTRGTYRCGTPLRVSGGVTLRGEGQEAKGTIIIATMHAEKAGGGPTLISMSGSAKLQVDKVPHAILDEVVPLGARKIKVADVGAFRDGDLITIERKAAQAWIHDLKMDQIVLKTGGQQWSPSGYTRSWQSRVVSVIGDTLTLDTPVMCALERRYGGGSVYKCINDPRARGAAVERLRLESVYQAVNETKDEDHAWTAISMSGLVDSWVRDVTALHFAYACVNVNRSCSRVTVQDCAMIDPVSEITGGRRYSFSAGGQYVLFQRCYTRNGRHDFVNGPNDIGPSVYLDCLSEKTHADIGPHHRWACGQLYDNVKGGQINIQDRGGMGSGHGWAGNCQVLWNCEGTSIVCQKPEIPSAQNWSIGCVGNKGKPALPNRLDGCWQSFGQHVEPRSLYLRQLKDRLGIEAVRAVATPEQLNGSIFEQLRRRYGREQ